MATDGVQYLREIRDIEKTYGLEGTYSFTMEYLDIEQYMTLLEEAILSGFLSLVAIFIVVLLFTGNCIVTSIVTLAVLLVI